jgi:hypothetical protein
MTNYKQNRSITRQTQAMHTAKAAEERDTQRMLRKWDKETSEYIRQAKRGNASAVRHVVNRLGYAKAAKSTGISESSLHKLYKSG